MNPPSPRRSSPPPDSHVGGGGGGSGGLGGVGGGNGGSDGDYDEYRWMHDADSEEMLRHLEVISQENYARNNFLIIPCRNNDPTLFSSSLSPKGGCNFLKR